MLVKWVQRQSLEVDQHIVVCDGPEPYLYRAYGEKWGRSLIEHELEDGNKVFAVYKHGGVWQDGVIQFFHRKPHHFERKPSIVKNWLYALPHIRNDFVICMEDDDYYHEDYLLKMCTALTRSDLVGVQNCHYWNFERREYKAQHNVSKSPLAATGFRMSSVGALMRDVCNQAKDVWLDRDLWNRWDGSREFIENRGEDGRALFVGIKGMPGDMNLGSGLAQKGGRDPNCEQLKRWVGVTDGLLYQKMPK